jgi:hypothetical protein
MVENAEKGEEHDHPSAPSASPATLCVSGFPPCNDPRAHLT